ncbi:ribonuclease H-like domain-containing protein [Umbelopsis sp. AD052]|nr:ribonuclease H-like domain-containing protein [Umbelopsis sp. AD052]
MLSSVESEMAHSTTKATDHESQAAAFQQNIDTLDLVDYSQTHTLFCTKSPTETNAIIRKMIKEGQVFGLDLEWRPTFIKGGKENKTALVQLCNSNSILIIQISRMGVFPHELKGLLQNRNILKTGVNIRGDALKLYRDFRILTNGLVELGTLARATHADELQGYKGLSLRLLCAIFLGKSLAKGTTRISRWDAPTLSSKQTQYAADDAYASFAVYQAIDDRRKPTSDSHVQISHLADDKVRERYKRGGDSKKSKLSSTVTDKTIGSVEKEQVFTQKTTYDHIEDEEYQVVISDSTAIERSSRSMPFTTTELLRKKQA